MRRVAVAFILFGALGVGACDMLPDSVSALLSRPQTAVSGAFKNGAFKGQLKVMFLEPKNAEDRNVQLLEPFGYKDSKGVDWDVPGGFVSDGASIPWSLWSFIGGPFDGPHRDAAIIHDYFCATKSRKWEDVHAMFLEAALRRGVSESTAQTMYAGILYGGPRWGCAQSPATRPSGPVAGRKGPTGHRSGHHQAVSDSDRKTAIRGAEALDRNDKSEPGGDQEKGRGNAQGGRQVQQVTVSARREPTW